MVSKDAVVAFAEQAEEAAQRLAAEGITLAYHNHHVDFAKHDGETLFDIVRRVSPTLHFEIDVHWVQRGVTRWTCCASSPARSNWCT
jgi:sugar phosphate isomerase/epimerase